MAWLARRVVGRGAESPTLIAIDGRSASGKTTFAERLGLAIGAASVVHTDDVAWHRSPFDWGEELMTGILDPLRTGRSVDHRPPAWDDHDRPGSIVVPAGVTAVLVEGVGCGRPELAPHFDVVLWVHAPASRRAEREQARVGAREVSLQLQHDWQRAEREFMSASRPWQQADLVVGDLRRRGDAAHDRIRVAPRPDGGREPV